MSLEKSEADPDLDLGPPHVRNLGLCPDLPQGPNPGPGPVLDPEVVLQDQNDQEVLAQGVQVQDHKNLEIALVQQDQLNRVLDLAAEVRQAHVNLARGLALVVEVLQDQLNLDHAVQVLQVRLNLVHDHEVEAQLDLPDPDLEVPVLLGRQGRVLEVLVLLDQRNRGQQVTNSFSNSCLLNEITVLIVRFISHKLFFVINFCFLRSKFLNYLVCNFKLKNFWQCCNFCVALLLIIIISSSLLTNYHMLCIKYMQLK